VSTLPREFFQRDPLTVARELIGCELVCGECAGIIVETEAYAAEGDEACHTFFRPSTRAFIAAHEAGSAYIYFNYGMYWLLNALVKGGSMDGFALIRAVEPRRGLDLMRERREKLAQRELCSGPGKLTQAFGITGAEHGDSLCGGDPIRLQQRREHAEVETCLRVGIRKSAHLPWRFLLKGSPLVSKAVGRAGPR